MKRENKLLIIGSVLCTIGGVVCLVSEINERNKDELPEEDKEHYFDDYEFFEYVDDDLDDTVIKSKYAH